MAKFCTKCGKPLEECTCNTRNYTPKNFMSVSDYFGVRESDEIDNSDCFEYGKKIVPDIASECDGEMFVKQYDIGKTRSRLTFSKGEYRLLVTNKRLVARCAGRSMIGKDVSHREYAIDDIAGVDFSKGINFSIGDFLMALLIGYVAFALGGVLSNAVYEMWLPITVSIVSIIVGVILYFTQHKTNNFLFLILSMFSCGTCISYNASNYSAYEKLLYGSSYTNNEFSFVTFLNWVMAILAIVFIIRYSFKQSISFSILTKSMSGSAMGMYSKRTIAVNRSVQVLPSTDTEIAIKELGAIITDIQKMGDFGAEKWKDKSEKISKPVIAEEEYEPPISSEPTVSYYVAEQIKNRISQLSPDDTKRRFVQLKRVDSTTLSTEQKLQLSFEIEACEMHYYEQTGHSIVD